MCPVRVRLNPRWDTKHTQLTMSLALPRALRSWELADLCAAVRAWTGRRTRVALSADAPSEWLDEWSETLEGADCGALEVEFVRARRDGGRR